MSVQLIQSEVPDTTPSTKCVSTSTIVRTERSATRHAIMPPHKVVALVSGGKDSCYSMMKCVAHGHTVVALANLHPKPEVGEELDSLMYQTVGHAHVGAIAEAMELPIFRREITGTAVEQGLRYVATEGDEV